MWFRQDLRLSDNAALAAAAAGGEVLFLHVLDDETPQRWRMGAASRWWLHRSLADLKTRVPLILRRGAAVRVIARVIAESGARALYFSRGYEPWSGELEARVKAACDERHVTCRRFGGFLLYEPGSIRNGQGQAYKVYTPFANACLAAGDPEMPRPQPDFRIWQGELASDRLEDWELLPRNPNWARGFENVWQPGEKGARDALQFFLAGAFANYAKGRDRPDMPATSRLSPHLHFGEIGPARVWHATRLAQHEAGARHDLSAEKFMKELLWRDFSYHLIHNWPELPDKPFRPEFADFPWASDAKALSAWQSGKTGYPIVDAGMRELWHTGYMHNRARMIAASFLVKHLLTHWREGERWFWDTLVDADIANNAAGWQWVAGCGADAAPYFRIFNPMLQGQKFDPDGTYVRRWVPELAELPLPFVHSPWTAPRHVLRQAGVELGSNYPHPIVDHVTARARALACYKSMGGRQT